MRQWIGFITGVIVAALLASLGVGVGLVIGGAFITSLVVSGIYNR